MPIIRVRRNTAANAAANNVTLSSGEIGFETDTGKIKIGDGSTAWNSLPYIDASTFSPAEMALVDGGTINWDFSVSPHAAVTINGSRTLANPTNLGSSEATVRVTQGAGAPYSLSFGSAFKFPSGVVPSLSPGAGSVDLLSFYCNGTNLFYRGIQLHLS